MSEKKLNDQELEQAAGGTPNEEIFTLEEILEEKIALPDGEVIKCGPNPSWPFFE